MTDPFYTLRFKTTAKHGVRVHVTDNVNRTSVMTLEIYACWINGLQTQAVYRDRSVYDADDKKWIVAPLEKLLA